MIAILITVICLRKVIFLSLFALRLRALGIEVYKCVRGLNPSYMNEFFEICDLHYSFRDPYRLKQPEFDTKTFGYRSFRYHGSKLWNILPVEVKNSESIPII